jgi:hypothetical protein
MIAIGTQFYPAGEEAGRRQRRAREAILALANVRPINLQFPDEHFEAGGFRTLPVLRQDSRTVTGSRGRRKPIVSEMFDALANAAVEEDCRYFVYLNADIEVSAEAISRVETSGRDGHAFCRLDVDPVTRAGLGVQIFGLDMFAVRVAWWQRHRRRFRPYIAGEACWDNVYAAVLCSHGDAEIVHDAPGIFHEQHSADRARDLFAVYNGYLAALDAPYFSRWTAYVARLQAALAAGGHVDERRLSADVFRGPLLSPTARAIHAARQLRARVMFARTRARLVREESLVNDR